MSKRANPTAIGLFIMGALVLSILGIVALSSNNLFRDKAVFVSSFRESVNGLAVGAKVKCQGVPVGEVKDLQLLIDLEEETFQVPVSYEIDLERLELVLASSLELGDYDALKQHIEKGLRAQLQLESIVTGQMYIELRYIDTAELTSVDLQALEPNEIPTTFSPMASLSSEASGLVSNLRSFNVNAISENLTALLVKANMKMDQLDMASVNASLLATSESIRQLAASENIDKMLSSLPQATEQFTETLVEMQDIMSSVDRSVQTITNRFGTTSTELNKTLRMARESIERANTMLTTDGGIGFHLEESLNSLTEAAEALRLLATTLEQNPSMFIRGKNETDQ